MGALEGQMAVITGGGSGVGAAITMALAAEKVNLYLIGRRLDRLEKVASRARELGIEAKCCSADLGSEADQDELTRRCEKATDFNHGNRLCQEV